MITQKNLVIICSVVSIVLGLLGVLFLLKYFGTGSETSLLEKSPRLQKNGSILETYNSACWMKGTLSVSDPENLLISREAKKPCLYYHFVSVTLSVTTNSDGDTREQWQLASEEVKYADMVLLVEDGKYSLKTKTPKVKGKLQTVWDRTESRDGTRYTDTEMIIPDKSEAWVFGIPGKNSIEPANGSLIINLGTIEELIGTKKDDTASALVAGIVFLVIALVLAGVVLRVGVERLTSENIEKNG
jgi:hypothetical protein